MNKNNAFKIALALVLAAALAGCGSNAEDIKRKSEKKVDLTVTAEGEVSAEPVNAGDNTLSHEKHGYGQGVIVDDENRTQGALDFNNQYKSLNAKAINEDSDKITLTFDQGYENGYTAAILDTLKEKNVKAIFFLVQDYAERNPELVQRMIDEGHTVANHSVHHYSMPGLNREECEAEIMGMHDYMKENFGVEMNMFRPPMGEYSEFSLDVTKACGYETVLWSFAYADWDVNNQPEPTAALEKLRGAAHKGAIYLLHSVSKTNAEILPQLIDDLRADGFEV